MPRAKLGLWTLNAWTQTATAQDMSDRRAINAGSISVPFERTRLLSKCSTRDARKSHDFSCLQEIHQVGAVIRSGEYRSSETACGPPGAAASAQPFSHNPRKQRKNPAAAGSGERFRGGKWRRGRDCRRTFSGRTWHSTAVAGTANPANGSGRTAGRDCLPRQAGLLETRCLTHAGRSDSS